MNQTSIIAQINKLLQSTEMFARPSKKIPGKWQLYEYYVDENKELKHIKREQLTSEKQNWNIEFAIDKKYIHNTNIAVSIISNVENGSWHIAKNFITLIHPNDINKNMEFQFAIEEGNLKLLKKDNLGKIEFFGFFKKLD